MKKRVGEIPRGARAEVERRESPNLERLVMAVTEVTRLSAGDFCSRSKAKAIVQAKEAMIIVAHGMGASNAALAKVMGLDSSVVSRRLDWGQRRTKASIELRKLVWRVRKAYLKVKS